MSNTVSFRVLPWTSPEPGQGYLIRKQLSVISIKLQIFTLQSFSFLFPSCRKHSPQHFLKLPFFFSSDNGVGRTDPRHVRREAPAPTFLLDMLINQSEVRLQMPLPQITDWGATLVKLPAKNILFTFLLPTKCQESFQVRAITVKENRT